MGEGQCFVPFIVLSTVCTDSYDYVILNLVLVFSQNLVPIFRPFSLDGLGTLAVGLSWPWALLLVAKLGLARFVLLDLFARGRGPFAGVCSWRSLNFTRFVLLDLLARGRGPFASVLAAV